MSVKRAKANKEDKLESLQAEIRFIQRYGAPYQRHGLDCAVRGLYNVIRRQRRLKTKTNLSQTRAVRHEALSSRKDGGAR